MANNVNRMTNLVDEVGTTKYTYSASGQMLTEDGPFASDTVTNIYWNRLRVNMNLQQPSGMWTNRFGYDPAGRLTNVNAAAGEFDYQYPACLPTKLVQKLLLPNTSYIANDYDDNARLQVGALEAAASTAQMRTISSSPAPATTPTVTSRESPGRNKPIRRPVSANTREASRA